MSLLYVINIYHYGTCKYHRYGTGNMYIDKVGIMSSDDANDKYMVQGDIIPFRRWGKNGLKNGTTGEVLLSAQYDNYIDLWTIATGVLYSDKFEWNSIEQEYDKENNVVLEVERDGKKGLLNVKGEVVIPVVYDYWEERYNVYVVGKDGKYGIISKENKEILPLEYSGIRTSSDECVYPYIIASKNGFWGVTDLAGLVHIPFEYEDIHLSKYFGIEKDSGTNTMFAYRRNASWGVKDTRGKEYLLCEYDEIRSYSIEDFLEYGYWGVRKDGKEGVLNSDSKVVIPFEYSSIHFYGSRYGLFEVNEYDLWRGWKSGVVNANNKVVLPIKSGSIYIDENTITRKYDYRGKEIYNHLGERIN